MASLQFRLCLGFSVEESLVVDFHYFKAKINILIEE